MDIKRGQRVRPIGYDAVGDGPWPSALSAPIMVVREILVECAWFTDDGKLNTAAFRLNEITNGTCDQPIAVDDTVFFASGDAATPQMVVREIYAVVTWFVNGAEHRSTYRADELEVVG